MNKDVKTSTLIKSSFWYTISGFFTRAIGFITVPIFTRILSKAELGDFSVYTTWLAVFISISGLHLENTLNKARFDFPDKSEFDAYVTSCLIITTTITSIIGICYFLFQETFYKILLIEDKHMIFMLIYLFALPAYSIFQAKQRITYKYKLNAAIAFSLVFSSSALAVVLTYFLCNDRLTGRIFGQYGLYIIAGFIFYVYFLLTNRRIKGKYFKYALRMGIPLALNYIASSVLLSSDNIVVKHMCVSEQLSYLSLCHTATHIVLILVQMLNSAWAPWLYDKLAVGSIKSIRKTYSIYLWGLKIFTFYVLLFAPEIILVLGGRSYHESVFILPANILAGFFTALTAQFVNIETYYKKPEYSAIITGAIAVVNLGLNILGVYLFGYWAVCYVTVLCYITAILVHQYISSKMDKDNIITWKELLIQLGSSLVIIPISLVSYMNDYIRFGIVVLSIVFTGIIVKRSKDKIVLVLKVFKR